MSQPSKRQKRKSHPGIVAIDEVTLWPPADSIPSRLDMCGQLFDVTNGQRLVEVAVHGTTRAKIGRHTYDFSTQQQPSSGSEWWLKVAHIKVTSDGASKHREAVMTFENELKKRILDLSNIEKDSESLQRRIVEDGDDEDGSLFAELGVMLGVMRQHNSRIKELQALTTLPVEFIQETVEESALLPPHKAVELGDVLEGVSLMWCPAQAKVPRVLLRETRRETEEKIEEVPPVICHDAWSVHGSLSADVTMFDILPSGGKAQLLLISNTNSHQVHVFSGTGDPPKSFGEKGYGTGQFNCPSGLAMLSDDQVAVVDSSNNRVSVWNVNGTYLRSFGSSGVAAGQFNYPLGIAASASRLIVADHDNHRVQVFDHEGVFVREIGKTDSGPMLGLGLLTCPLRVAAGNGHIAVWCLASKVCSLFKESDGSFVRCIDIMESDGDSWVTGLAVHSGMLYTIIKPHKSAFHQLVVFTLAGMFVRRCNIGVPDTTSNGKMMGVWTRYALALRSNGGNNDALSEDEAHTNANGILRTSSYRQAPSSTTPLCSSSAILKTTTVLGRTIILRRTITNANGILRTSSYRQIPSSSTTPLCSSSTILKTTPGLGNVTKAPPVWCKRSFESDSFLAAMKSFQPPSLSEAEKEAFLKFSTVAKIHHDNRVLDTNGIQADRVFRNVSVPQLYEHALAYERGSVMSATGALIAMSGTKTGRSPMDKRVVDEPSSSADVWWGPVNKRPSPESFMTNRERAIDYLATRERLYVVDAFAGADPANRIKVRVVTSRAYHALFMWNMLIRPSEEELAAFGKPDYTIYNAGEFPANRYTAGMTSGTSVSLNFSRGEMVILGTEYAGEMKKGVFTIMNYLMPKKGILSMHASANEGRGGDVSIFFGLSGTGKTTLSSDPARALIGDDEHCWTDEGVFNIEGGCYAKSVDLSPQQEPEIFAAAKYGSILENVGYHPFSREVDYSDVSKTENTRLCYPLTAMAGAKLPSVAGHPKNIIMLTCDAFGVLPPVSKLTPAQAMYHFMSGYTAKIAGTEDGITEPQSVFSACFGAPFLVWHPAKYAELLAAQMDKFQASAWLVNTGWSGGAYGTAGGDRLSLKYTRALIDAIHSGELDACEYNEMPVFGLQVPREVKGVPTRILMPANAWADQAAYADQVQHLAGLFREAFKEYEEGASQETRNAAPK